MLMISELRNKHSHFYDRETEHRSRSRACVLPEAGERFVTGSGDERHVNPLAADFIAMQQTDGADGLLERTHVHPRLQLIVSVRTQIHTLHLRARTHTRRVMKLFQCTQVLNFCEM